MKKSSLCLDDVLEDSPQVINLFCVHKTIKLKGVVVHWFDFFRQGVW